MARKVVTEGEAVDSKNKAPSGCGHASIASRAPHISSTDTGQQSQVDSGLPNRSNEQASLQTAEREIMFEREEKNRGHVKSEGKVHEAAHWRSRNGARLECAGTIAAPMQGIVSEH